MAFLLFYITHPDETTARRVSGHLLERHLAACANIFPIASAYWWAGAIQQEGEWVSVVKTTRALEAAVEAEVLKIHPYEMPCIMRFEARANADYEKWIEDNCTASHG